MRSNHSPAISVDSDETIDPNDWVKLVKQSVGALQFGIIQIVVHNAKVVQIEKTEKLRLDHQAH